MYELAVSLAVYFKSVKKMKICFEKKAKPNKTTKKKISLAGVKPPTFDVQGQGVIYCATTTNFKQNRSIYLSLTFLPIKFSGGRW